MTAAGGLETGASQPAAVRRTIAHLFAWIALIGRPPRRRTRRGRFRPGGSAAIGALLAVVMVGAAMVFLDAVAFAAQGRAVDEMQMGVDDHSEASPYSVLSHLTGEFFIQIRIYADEPTVEPARCDSFSQVASKSSMVRVMSGAEGVLITLM